MRSTLYLHIAAGTAGLLAGYLALVAAKGATLHRRSGMVFVYTMVAMCVAGLVIAVGRSVAPEINVPAALLTSYLVITALTTVRENNPLSSRGISVAMMLIALGVALVMSSMALEAFASGGKRNGMPAFPFVMFATIGTLGVIGDARVLRSGARTGKARLARHLWRMSFALFIAALSFSVQAAKLLSRAGIKLPGVVIALPMLAVLGTMFYWLWRMRRRQTLRGVTLTVAEAVP